MLKRFIFVMLALAMAFAFTDPASARGSRGSHSSGHGRSSDGYVTKACKTNACFKKHPDGRYSAPLGKKRKH